jgi:hypothetical protein
MIVAGLPLIPDVLADHRRSGAEIALPDAVGDERHFLRARLVVFGREVAADHRRNAEAGQELFRHVGAGVALRFAVRRYVHRRAVQIGGEPFKRLLLRQQLGEVHSH